jgi:hypothetical protein
MPAAETPLGFAVSDKHDLSFARSHNVEVYPKTFRCDAATIAPRLISVSFGGKRIDISRRA